MNFISLFKAFNAVMAFAESAKRFRTPPDATGATRPPAPSALQGTGPTLGAQLETRLTSVVVAALKEAFDRDHARLELERAQLDAERHRAEAALGLELQRQAVDRELARLRLLAAAAMVGWIASIAMMAGGVVGGSNAGRVALVLGWVLLLAALGAAFTAQGRVGAPMSGGSPGTHHGASIAALWLLLGGLAATAASLLV